MDIVVDASLFFPGRLDDLHGGCPRFFDLVRFNFQTCDQHDLFVTHSNFLLVRSRGDRSTVDYKMPPVCGSLGEAPSSAQATMTSQTDWSCSVIGPGERRIPT